MDEAVEHGQKLGIEDCRRHDLEQPWPLEAGSARAIVLLDVLEHMARPVQVLRNAYDVLQPGGGLVITVPACPWLFGDWDRRLGHYRRYTAKELRSHAAEASLQVKWLNHWNAFSFPAAVAIRGVQRMFPGDRQAEFPRVSQGMNRMLQRAAGFERWCMVRLSVPVGLSLVGVLTK